MLRSRFNNRAKRSNRAFARLAAIATVFSALSLPVAVFAQPAGGPSGLKNPGKKGVTLIQANGLKGVIYLKVVPQINPQGEHTGDKLDFLYNMNTNMKWLVRYDLPTGHAFKGLSVMANTQGASVSPATADSWNGITMIDTVTIKPWSMVRVLQQCEQHLKKPDGTYKQSAVFNLQPGVSERVRAKGVSIPPGAPPSNAVSSSGYAFPRTRVSAYILDARSARKPRSSGFSQEIDPKIRQMIPTSRPNKLPQRPASTSKPQANPVGRPVQRFPRATSARPLLQGRTTPESATKREQSQQRPQKTRFPYVLNTRQSR